MANDLPDIIVSLREYEKNWNYFTSPCVILLRTSRDLLLRPNCIYPVQVSPVSAHYC